jgi:hypothetical protein
MTAVSRFELVPVVLAWIFAGLGILHIVAPRRLVNTYRKLGYPAGYPVFLGVLNIGVAVLLSYPERRMLGVAIAAMMLFAVNAVLLSQRHYVSALAGTALMLALPFAAASAMDVPARIAYAESSR